MKGICLAEILIATMILLVVLTLTLPTIISRCNQKHKIKVPIEVDYDFNR